jgi:hypothetical protein
MEKRIVKKYDTFMVSLKEGIKNRAVELNLLNDNEEATSKLLQFIYDFEGIKFDKEDFEKRKRFKNIVPVLERCCAKRSNGEQCSRKRKDDTEFCGTHLKCCPNGTVQIDYSEHIKEPSKQKIEIYAQDIQGIIYYIDSTENVYKMEDILLNKSPPTIIAKYKKIDNKFTITHL